MGINGITGKHHYSICNNNLMKLYKGSNKFNVYVWLRFINCSDVADVEDVKFVINFDYPSNSEDYVHRIGRTGRSQRTGTAYTFFTPSNANKAADLVAVLKEAKQVINPKLQDMANKSWGSSGSSRGGTLFLTIVYIV